MQTLVLCHTTADFDALGAAVGLTCLNPGAKVILTGGSHPGVQSFLALYRDELPLAQKRTINPDEIKRLMVVDTQTRNRVGQAASWLDLRNVQEIVVYDHHPFQGDIPATATHVDQVGATTTLVVEELQQAQVSLSSIEATVMALGIHTDTGSLTFPQTTFRDAQALAWLMEHGAIINVIGEYVEPSLSPELKQLLSQALEQAETETIQGYTLAWVSLEGESFIPGLSSVVERLVDLIEADVLLLAHVYRHNEHQKRTSLIARSRLPRVDLNQILSPFGGGGHTQAASASLKTGQIQPILSQLLEQIKASIPHPPTAKELMSSPVRTIPPETTVEQAQRILLRYGHSGLSVVDETHRLIGIISRRDLDLALHHGFGHAPVKGYMSGNLKTIAPDTPLPEIEELMVTYDVGRLPILDENHQLLGIVTRTDVLRQLHEERGVTTQQETSDAVRSACLLPDLENRLIPALWQFLMDATEAAQQRGWELYIVGGTVRDILLADPKEPLFLHDVDLVVDAKVNLPSYNTPVGVELAKALQSKYPEARLDIHGAFQTAALLWHHHPELDSLWVDIATARTEFYPYPAANPEVEAGSIRQDLYRRDFTINALALRLTGSKRGELLDFFGGLLDLRSRLIRVLHANSFIEDPTRIYRAVRFAVRLGFQIESQTEQYIRYAIASGVYERYRSGNQRAPALQTRLKAELKMILEAGYWQPALHLLSDLTALRCLHPQLELDQPLWWQLRFLGRFLNRFDANHSLTHWQMRLEVMIAYLDDTPARVDVAQQLELPNETVKRLEHLAEAEQTIEQQLSQPLSEEEISRLYQELRQQRSQLFQDESQLGIEPYLFQQGYRPQHLVRVLQSYQFPVLVLLAVRGNRQVRKRIWQYLTQWSNVKADLNGNDLKALGYQPGPQYRKMLDHLLDAKLDGIIQNQAEAKQFLVHFYPH